MCVCECVALWFQQIEPSRVCLQKGYKWEGIFYIYKDITDRKNIQHFDWLCYFVLHLFRFRWSFFGEQKWSLDVKCFDCKVFIRIVYRFNGGWKTGKIALDFRSINFSDEWDSVNFTNYYLTVWCVFGLGCVQFGSAECSNIWKVMEIAFRSERRTKWNPSKNVLRK